jgi:hypothetical protein
VPLALILAAALAQSAARLTASTHASSNFRSNEFTMLVLVEKQIGSCAKLTSGVVGTRYF